MNLIRIIRGKLQADQTLRKITVNTVWLTADRVVRMGIGLIVAVWVARYLGPEQFGILNYALAFVALFTAFATLGLEHISIREIVRNTDVKYDIIGTTFYLKLSGAIVACVCIGVAVTLIRPDDPLTRTVVMIVAGTLIFHAFDVIDYWFQSQVQSKYSVIARNSAFLIIAGTQVYLILRAAPLEAFAFARLAEFGIAALGLTVMYHLTRQRIAGWSGSLKTAKSLLRDSWPLLFSGIMITIYMRIDQVMIGQMVGDAEVGIYSAAVRLSEVWYFIPMAIVSSTFPSIVRAKEANEELFYTRLQRLYNLMTFLGYAVAIPATFVAGYIIESLFGSEYSAAGSMLAVLIWGGIFVNLGVARSSFLTTMNWTRLHLLSTLFGCIINVALNFILIPFYGGVGAAISSVAAYWFTAHGSCLLHPSLHRTGKMISKALVFPKFWDESYYRKM